MAGSSPAARSLIEPHGGHIVEEFFDIDKSRSIPPQRRPEASRLLAALADPNRGFEGVVVGEPQRAFYGNQFGNTFPLFAHYGVPLWVPEIGGPIDPDNEAHDLIMSVFGGVSKGERNRIKIRVRTAMAAQAQIEGRFLGGRPPYGYKLADAGPHPNPAKAADGKRLHTLAIDQPAAEAVAMIFYYFLAGHGFSAIAEKLTAEGIPSPSAHDPKRNPHRCGLAWSHSAVRAILINPRYTGRQVWNKQRKDEVLIDVHDVALGHTTKMRWNEAGQWIYSDQVVHPPIIGTDTFSRAQAMLAAKSKAAERGPRRSPHPYSLRGILFCGICGRRMQGSWNNEAPYYRCVFLREYAAKNKIDHPRAVYLREDQLIPQLDRWLATKFSPPLLSDTITELARAQEDPQHDQAADQARQDIADCDAKLRQHRAALEAGADPAIVASWMAEVQAKRTLAEARLTKSPKPRRMTREEIDAMVTALHDIISVLNEADPADKTEIYGQLGVRLMYQPGERIVIVQARPLDSMYVRTCPRGDLNPHALLGH